MKSIRPIRISLVVLLSVIAHDIQAQSSSTAGNSNLQAGIAKFRNGDYAGASNDFVKAIENSPQDYRGYRWNGRSLGKLNRDREAIPFYTKALELNKNDTLSYKGRAEAKRVIGLFKESIPDYNIFMDFNPNDADAHYGRGGALFETGELDKALEDYNFSIKKYPRFAPYYRGRMMVYGAQRQYEKVKKDANTYLQLGGKENSAYYYRGVANVYLTESELPKLDSATRDLERYTTNVEPTTGESKAFRLLGLAYTKKGDSVKARINYKRSLELSPNNVNAYLGWGAAELRFKNYVKANELMSVALEKMSPAEIPDDFYLNFALTKEGIGDITTAVYLLDKCIEADSNKRVAYRSRIRMVISDPGYTETILSDVDNLIRLTYDDSEKADWHAVKAFVYMRAQDITPAKKEMEMAVNLAPTEPLHYLLLAAVDAGLDQSEGVIFKNINEALALNPQLPEAYALKASYFALKKNHRQACQALKQAMDLNWSISKELQAYYCSGKLPKDGKEPQYTLPLSRVERILNE